MAREQSRTISQEENNIIYVEPNYSYSTEMYGSNGLNTYEFIPPAEDYSIYVNLKVETRGRTIRTNATNDSKELILSFESDISGRTSVNLMEGTRLPVGDKGGYINSLTTNYTNIFIGDWKKKPRATIEMFGINSIDVAYNSYMVPEVTIQFTDIRGAAVFGPKEAHETALNDAGTAARDEDIDIANTFFQCFFTFPYPKFTLLLKGFYGQPVSYELTCADFRAKFNSSTGNFDCTAKFVGYHFSFLADVMFNILAAAPYSDYIGEDYWNSNNFTLVSYGSDEKGARVPKLAEVVHQLKYAEEYAKRVSATEPEVQEAIIAQSSQANSQQVQAAYNAYINVLTSKITERSIGTASYDAKYKIYFEDANSQGYAKNFVYFVNAQEETKTLAEYLNCVQEAADAYKVLTEKIEEYNEIPNSMKISELENLITEAHNSRFCEHLARISIHIKENDNDSQKAYVDWGNTNVPDFLKNEVESLVAEGNKEDGINPYLSNNFTKAYFFHCVAGDDIDRIIKSTSNIEEKTAKSLIEKNKSYITKILGWRPSVENMTRIVMAHFSTLAYMIFKTGYDIASENPRRTMASLGINDADDLSDVTQAQKNTYVPPFPKVTKKTTHEGDPVREETWVGEYNGSGFLEKELVHGLINGVNAASERMYESASTSFEGEYTTPSLTQMGSNGALTTVMAFPLSTIDLIADKNIYVSGDFDENDVSSLLGLVALRGIQFFDVSSDLYGYDSEKAKLAGKLEWVNYLKSVGSISSEMNQKLSGVKQNIDSIIEMLNGNESDIIRKPESGKWPWEVNDETKAMISENKFNLFKNFINVRNEINIGIMIPSFSKKGDTTSFPYQNLGWNTLNGESYEGNIALNSEDYINTFAGIPKKNVFTIETNIDRFNQIAENQFGHATADNAPQGTLEFKEKIIKYRYDKDTYESNCIGNLKARLLFILKNADKIIPTENSGMLPTSSRVAIEIGQTGRKVFGVGYNMDNFKETYPGTGGQGLFARDWKTKDGEDAVREGPEDTSAYDMYIENLNDFNVAITEFPGLNKNAKPFYDDGDPGTSIFSQVLYYDEESEYKKAILFLCSLGDFYWYNKIVLLLANDTPMVTIPLAAVMFFGGLLWLFREGGINMKSVKVFETYKFTFETLIKLNDDVQRELIRTFKYWVTTGVEGNSILTSFNHIRDGLELKLKTTAKFDSITDFLFKMGEFEDGCSWIENCGYNNLLLLLGETFTDDFFRNYICIDEDKKGSRGDRTYGMRLGLRDGAPCVIDAVNFTLAGCVFVKHTKFFNKEEHYLKSDNNFQYLKPFFEGFLDDIKETSEDVSLELTTVAKIPSGTTDDIKVGIYRYCKLLYDKWLAGLTIDEFEKNWTMKKFFESDDRYFHFIDSFYNLYGHAPINIGHFADTIVDCFQTDSQYSLLSFLSNIYSHNKFLFLCIQNFIDLSKVENMKTMFNLVPYTHTWSIKENPNFIVMYPNEPSSHLDIENGQYEDDSFMINDTFNKHKWPEALQSRNAGVTQGYRVPAFGVSFGKLYQSYFKDIEVGMDNPVVTEQSIKAQYQIASNEIVSKQKDGTGKVYTYGQDLYAIYSNNSYTCNVTMMGCAWVQPLMYFVLNNVPMFRGTYLIEKVSHHIEPGNMITKFMGVRMANISARITEECAVYSFPSQTGEGSGVGGGSVIGGQSMQDLQGKYADIDNDCPYKTYPLTTDSVLGTGGDYGEENYSNYFNMKIGDIKGNKLGEPWRSRPFLDSITAALCAESDGTELGIMLVAATMYNRVRSQKGSIDLLANKAQYSVWINGRAEERFNNHPSIWDKVKECATKMFTNGACSCLAGTKFTIPSDWDVNRNGNNDLYNFEAGKEYTLTCEQVSQMFCYGFKQEWHAQFKINGRVPDNQIRKKVCKLLAILGTNRPQAVCSSPPYTNNTKITCQPQYYAEPAKLEGNADEKVSELATGFLNALDRTCAMTLSNVKLGYVKEKSDGDTIYIKPAEDEHSKANFSKVFDAIINGYGDKVSDVKWVTNTFAGYNSEPVGYLVTVKEGSNITIISVVDSNNLNSPVDIFVQKSNAESSSAVTDNSKAIHINFVKALRKKYSNIGAAQLSNDVIGIDSDEANTVLNDDAYKLKNCSTVLSEAGYGSAITTGGAGKWAESVKKMAAWYAENITTYQGNTCNGEKCRKNYDCPLLGKSVADDCTAFVGACLSLYGIELSHWPGSAEFIGDGNEVVKKMLSNGFERLNYAEESLQPFDIVSVYDCTGGKCKPGEHHHAEIYAGTDSNGKKLSYSWGKVHNNQNGGLPCAFSKQPYKYIYRCTASTISDTPFSPQQTADLIGFSGEVTNEKMKKVLRYINDFCIRHQYSSKSSWYDVSKTTGGRFGRTTNGMCTYSVSTWYAYSDVNDGETPKTDSAHDLRFWSSPTTSTFNELKANFNRYGFKLVWHGTIAQSLELDKNPSAHYRPGDVSTQHYYKTNGSASSHACMWTGHDWRSDFKQNQMVAGRTFKDRQGNYSMCIWRHPDYQEPGQTVVEIT